MPWSAPTAIDPEFVCGLLREAGKRFILPRWQSLTKADILHENAQNSSELVTKADTLSETFLRRAIRQRYPNIVVIGEEKYAKIGRKSDGALKQKAYLEQLVSADLCITLDPVDGTTRFGQNDPRYATILGIWRHGEIVEAFIVCHSMNHAVIHAIRDQGTFISYGDPQNAWNNNLINATRVTFPTKPWPRDKTKAFMFPFNKDELKKLANFNPISLEPSFGQAGEIAEYMIACLAPNGPQYNLLHVFQSSEKWRGETPWDYGTALAIIEAGGYVINTSATDNPYRNKGERFLCVMSSDAALGREAGRVLLDINTSPTAAAPTKLSGCQP